MKILRVTSLGYESGGADTGIALLSPILAGMGHEVKILTSDLGPQFPHFADAEFVAIDGRPFFLKLVYRIAYPNSYRALRRILREFEPDIVHLHTMREVSASVLFLLKDYPTIMTIHGTEDFLPSLLLWGFPPRFFKNDSFERKSLTAVGWLHYVYHRYIGRPVYRMGFKNVDRFVVLSRYMQSQIKKDEIESVYIPNGTELFPYAPVDTGSMFISYVGRLEKAKGVEYLIRALPEILKAHPSAVLEIAGTGSYTKELERLVHELGLETHVRFLGHKDRKELYDLYKRSALIVMPSVWPEPFGKVGIEAMSVGRPVIASDVGGISEWLIDGEGGYLVPPKDPSAIAEKAILLLSNRTLLETMSRKARERATAFDIQTHAEKMVALYEEVMRSCKNLETKASVYLPFRNSDANASESFRQNIR